MMWRESTRSEIQQYYRTEFPSYLGGLPDHITPNGPKEYALAFRESYPTRRERGRNFIRRSTRRTNNADEPIATVFEEWPDILEFIREPAANDPLRNRDNGAPGLADPATVDEQVPIPEAVYYATDQWDRNWVLPVDIDAKDVAYERALEMGEPRSGESQEEFIERVGIIDEDPEGYKYAFEDIEQALVYGFAVKDIFEDTLNAEWTQVVYSGQGCHIYLLDDDTEHQYDQRAREVLVEFLEHDYDIPIDSVVTADEARVMRLPYSLHAGVSRVVTPIESPDFDFRRAALPETLSEPASGQT